MPDQTPPPPAPGNAPDPAAGHTARDTGRRPTVLVTGFEPFGGDTVNASWEAVRALRDLAPSGITLETARLSCVFGTAIDELRQAVQDAAPDLILAVGEAGGRPDLTLERVAINVDDARIPDNAGRQPIDEPIAEDGPAAYFSQLPVKACVEAVRAAGVPASVSQTAGTFVCNHIAYGLAHLIATERPGVRGGFVHVPLTPEQAVRRPGHPTLSARDTVTGLAAVITAALATTTDLRVTGGATH